MINTSLQIVDLKPRWGLVTVANPDGSVNRAYRITAEQEAAVRLAGACPVGCSLDEWKAGRVIVSGRPCEAGQAVVHANGWLLVNCGISESAGRVDVRHLLIPPQEWALEGSVVRLVPAVYALWREKLED